MAGELLRAEGFTDVRYVQGDKSVDHSVWIANNEMDFSLNYVPVHLTSIEAGVPIKVLGGLHSGCLELIANDSVTASRTCVENGSASILLLLRNMCLSL